MSELQLSGVVGVLLRFLPREFRDRVVEPAYNDLLAEELADLESFAAHRAWSRVRFSFSCLRVGVPQLFWNRGRPTLLASSLAFVFAGIGFLVWVVGVAASYAAQPGP